MKIALISDIHSNYFYLAKVLSLLKKHSFDAVYSLGDIIGYYNQPNECIELLISENVVSIKGNHEKYLLNELDYKHENENIYRIEYQRTIISDKNKEYLKSLPDELILNIESNSIYITHSLPKDCTSYLYKVDGLDRDFVRNYNFYCYGHTHIPIITSYFGTCVVNPGSIGQPRDYSQQSSFAILDFAQKKFSIVKVKQDYQDYINSLKEKRYDDSLIKILER